MVAATTLPNPDEVLQEDGPLSSVTLGPPSSSETTGPLSSEAVDAVGSASEVTVDSVVSAVPPRGRRDRSRSRDTPL